MTKRKLDLMKTESLVQLFLSEEEETIKEIKKQKLQLTKAINKISANLDKDGRVFYIGAGTSGRLGLLDAVECMPTFSTKSFQGIIAGGKNAFIKAKEGAEDSEKDAIGDLKKLKLKKYDVLVGIAASGETPYTLSALKYANKKKLLTIGITSNPKSSIAKTAKLSINPKISSEIISGSSRLRSGTAQKLILNMISSITMIKSGKVYDDLMIDVQPTNKKLVKRAIGIISMVCKLPLNKAEKVFIQSGKNTKIAIVMNKMQCSKTKAITLLNKKKGNLRKVIS